MTYRQFNCYPLGNADKSKIIILLYKTVIRQVVFYAHETWTMNKT